MRVIENKSPPLTHTQLAAFDFAAVKVFRGMTRQQRVRRMVRMVRNVRHLAAFATGVLAFDKAELVENVRKDYATHAQLYLALIDGKEQAREIMQIITNAETTRLAVATAYVENEFELPPDDGGEAA
jgi:hypothetical protein